MSPGIRFRLWSRFHQAALAEPLGSPQRTRFKSLAYLVAYGADMHALAASLHRLTSPLPRLGAE